jgi:hypothetical protein
MSDPAPLNLEGIRRGALVLVIHTPQGLFHVDLEDGVEFLKGHSLTENMERILRPMCVAVMNHLEDEEAAGFWSAEEIEGVKKLARTTLSAAIAKDFP